MQSSEHQYGPSGRAERGQEVDAKDDGEHGQVQHDSTIGTQLASSFGSEVALRRTIWSLGRTKEETRPPR
jgi:hypothetical protein